MFNHTPAPEVIVVPAAGGVDRFSFTGTRITGTATATITIAPVADVAADSATVDEDGSVIIAPLANDSFEGPARITAVAGQSIAPGGSVTVPGGIVSLDANDRLTFTPAADSNGAVAFTYTATSGGVSETVTVTVAVAAVNDAPTLIVPATIAATAVGMEGRESEILRRVVVWSLVLLLAVCTLVYLQSNVLAWMLPAAG